MRRRATTLAMALERGEVVGGVFEIERVLETDYGVTSYRGRHLMTGKPSRVRVMAPHKCLWAKPLLERADELVAIDPTGLARCLGHGRVGRSQVFLAFEWLRGETVDELLPAPLERRLVLEMASNVGEALACLYEIDLVHGHVRPDQILLEAKGERGPVLLDPALPPADGLELGSASYMSPESFVFGVTPGCASDVYALGASLHHALFGRPAHAGKTRLAIWLRTLFDSRETLASLADGDPFMTLIGRMLAPEPLERPLAGRVRSIADDALEGKAVAKIPAGSSAADAQLTTPGALLLVRGLPWQDPFFMAVLEEAIADSRIRLVRLIDDTAALRFSGVLEKKLGSRLHATIDTLRRASRLALAGCTTGIGGHGDGAPSLDALVDTFALTPAGQERLSPPLMEIIHRLEIKHASKRSGGTLELEGEKHVKRGKHGTLVMEEPDDPAATDERPTLETSLPTMEIPVDPILIASSTPSNRGTVKELKDTGKHPKRKPAKTLRSK